MYDVTLTYPGDPVDTTERGTLYLPGYPLPATVVGDYCSFCGNVVGNPAAPTQHDGVVVTGADHHPVDREALHLRCVADTARLGDLRLTIG